MAKKEAKIEPIRYRCKGQQVIQEGELVGRMECGRDITALIEAVPWDGKDHQIVCRCGNKATIKRIPE